MSKVVKILKRKMCRSTWSGQNGTPDIQGIVYIHIITIEMGY